MNFIKSYYNSTKQNFEKLKNVLFPSQQNQNSREISKFDSQICLKDIQKELESYSVRAIEISLWSNPFKSSLLAVISHLFIFYVCCWTSSILATSCYFILSLYVYLTVTRTLWPVIRVEPDPDADNEWWTELDPHIPSPPEIQTTVKSVVARVQEISSGLVLMRREQPRVFCAIMSSVFIIIASLGTSFSTQFLLHFSSLLLIVLPGIVVKLNRNENMAGLVSFVTSLIVSFSEFLVYRGVNYVQQEYYESKELSGNLVIPSHEDVENESLNTLLEFEQGLQLQHGEKSLEHFSESESDNDTSGDVIKEVDDIRDFNDSEDDSLSLDPGQGAHQRVRQEAHQGVRQGAPASTGVNNVVSDAFSSNLSSVLGSIISNTISSAVTQQQKQHRVVDNQDFEIISEDDLFDEDDYFN